MFALLRKYNLSNNLTFDKAQPQATFLTKHCILHFNLKVMINWQTLLLKK